MPAQYVTLLRVSTPRSLPVLCTVTSTLVPPSTETTRRTITFPLSSPICSPNIALSFPYAVWSRQTGCPTRHLFAPSCGRDGGARAPALTIRPQDDRESRKPAPLGAGTANDQK